MTTNAPHGEIARYSAGCRCEECRAANAAYQRDYRQGIRRTRKRWRETMPHGTVAKYNGGCKCDPCKAAYSDAVPGIMRLRRHGMTENEYTFLLNAQGGGCALCTIQTIGRSFDVDHAHTCPHNEHESCELCWRGLLCSECNKQLERNVGHAYLNEIDGCATDADRMILDYIRNPPANILRSRRQNRTGE